MAKALPPKWECASPTIPCRRPARQMSKLRQQAGSWLRELRERRGLSQRELAEKVGLEYYTFVSQLEHGRGRIPVDSYLAWADALRVERREFVCRLMSYYEPSIYQVLFPEQEHSLSRAEQVDD
jgi:transcriptional regulator with XRE-family HTH domain